jgi:hypothetical protein
MEVGSAVGALFNAGDSDNSLRNILERAEDKVSPDGNRVRSALPERLVRSSLACFCHDAAIRDINGAGCEAGEIGRKKEDEAGNLSGLGNTLHRSVLGNPRVAGCHVALSQRLSHALQHVGVNGTRTHTVDPNVWSKLNRQIPGHIHHATFGSTISTIEGCTDPSAA